MRGAINRVWGYFLVGAVALSSFQTNASRPKKDFEKDAQECQEYLEDKLQRAGLEQMAVRKSFMPFSIFYRFMSDPFLGVLWWGADSVAREEMTPGLGQLLATSNIAIDAILDEIPAANNPRYSAHPEYPLGDFQRGYEETIRLIHQERPRYIRNAVLIKDNILTIVPLLRLKEKGNLAKKIPPIYEPVIVKGHQEIEEYDILGAAFAAWALESVQGTLPEEATIYIKPMAEIRAPVKRKLDPFFTIKPKAHLARLKESLRELWSIVEDIEVLKEIEPQRNTHSSASPYISFIRKILENKKSLWAMPFPPKPDEIEELKKMGFGDTAKLSKINPNTETFMRVAAQTGIRPDRLMRYIARAISKEQRRPVVLHRYNSPLKNADGTKKWRLHVDFEDITEPDIRGGVYLVGWLIESPDGKFVDKGYFLADEKDQDQIDDVMAELFRLPKTNKHLKNRDYAITVFSHHEETKIGQTLDIIEPDITEVPDNVKRSALYREISHERYNEETEETDVRYTAQLIRNKEFFKKYPDLQPDDVFGFMDGMVDLLPYFRGEIQTWNYTNSLKKIVDVFGNRLLRVEYPPGHNGLEVGAWINDYWRTGDPAGRDRAIRYVFEDVYSNAIAGRAVDKFHDRPVDKSIRLDKAHLEAWESIDWAVTKSRRIVGLRDQHRRLNSILDFDFFELGEEKIEEFKGIIDLGEYYAARRSINSNDDYNESERRSLLAREKVRFQDERAEKLIEFFEKENPKLLSAHHGKSHVALAEFLSMPTTYLWPSQIDKMYLVSLLEPVAPRVRVAKVDQKHLELPENWQKYFDKFSAKLDEKSVPLPYMDLVSSVSGSDMNSLVMGIYICRLFKVDIDL